MHFETARIIRRPFLLLVAVYALMMPVAHPGQASTEPSSNNGKTYVFECSSGSDFVVDTRDEGTWLFRDQQTLRLEEPKGLVAYTAPGIELLIVGEDATLREEGQITQFCHNNPKRAIWEHAKLNGVDFRAIGNEPGWSLEMIQGKQIVFIGNYGAVRIERPLPEPITDEASRTTHWNAQDLKIKVSGKPCQDDMSGESFESSVIVYWNDQQLHGCGKALH